MIIGITGASGNLGQTIIPRLAPHHELICFYNAHPIAREKINFPHKQKQIDYGNLAELKTAFQGLDRLIFIPSPLGGQTKRTHHENILKALPNDLERLVFIGFYAAAKIENFDIQTYAYTEELIRDKDVSSTIIRNSLYAELIMVNSLVMAYKSGVLASPYLDTEVALPTITQLGEAIATISLMKAPKALYSLTASCNFSIRNVLNEFIKLTGKNISTKHTSVEDVISSIPQEQQRVMFKTLIEHLLNGTFSKIEDDFTEITGHSTHSPKELAKIALKLIED